MKTFKATGGWGDLYCDATTGGVVLYDRGGDWQKPGDGYDNIVRLDVDEWRSYWPGGDLFAGHDILDFGSWDSSGVYCGPEMDWRESLLEDRPELAKEHTIERTVKSPGEQPDGEWQDNLGESPDY